MEASLTAFTGSAVTARHNGDGASVAMVGATMRHVGVRCCAAAAAIEKMWKVSASTLGEENVSVKPDGPMESERRGAQSRDDGARVATMVTIDTAGVLKPCAVAPPSLQPAASVFPVASRHPGIGSKWPQQMVAAKTDG